MCLDTDVNQFRNLIEFRGIIVADSLNTLKPNVVVVHFSFNSEAKIMLQNKLDIKHNKHIF